MTNPISALYRVIQKNLPGAKAPLASDVNQFVDLFNGNLDGGTLQFAGQIASPSITGLSGAASVGTALGIGQYIYKLTFVTGNLQADNTATVGGETPGSSSLTVTTTSGNQNVTLSGLPVVSSWPVTAIGINIYRTAVGGSDGTQKLVGSIYTNYARSSSQTSFVDSVADASLGKSLSTTNTTGTSINESSLLGKREMIPDYDQYASSPDSNGIYTILQLKRPDGTLYMKSTLSNPDTNGNYQTDTWQFYDSTGNTVVTTHVWSITWDSYGKASQKVMTS